MFHVFDPNVGGNCVAGSYETIEEAMEGAAGCIQEYRDACDPEWPLDVDSVAIEDDLGRIVAKCVMCDAISKPDDCDADDYSPSLGLSFHGVDYYCDYKMELV